MPNKKSKGKQCINLHPGKTGRILLRHLNPVYNPRVDAIVDNANGTLTFNVLDTKWFDNTTATVRFTITIAAAAPPPAGGPVALVDTPTDGNLTVTLVDDPSTGPDIPVDVDPVQVDYVDDPDDP